MSTIYLAQAEETITITTSIPSTQTFDDDLITIYAQLSNSNMTRPPYIQFSFTATEAQPPFMDEWATGIYKQNIDFSHFPDGVMQILVVSGEYNDMISVTIDHSTASTPPADTLKTMRIIGISNALKITDNETRMIYVKTNNTDQAVEGATIYILKDASTICNTFMTSTSGRAKIEWIDTDGKPLPNDIYFFKIERPEYRTIEYDIEIDYSEEEEEKPELDVWGLDRKYNTDSIAPDIIRVKGSDTDKYLSDVVIKIITGSGVPVTDNMITNEYGTIDFKTSGITPGSYSVVFEHPDYETKLQDITISYVPTPTPTPPTEFIWSGITFPIPHTVTLRDGTVKSYSTSLGFDTDFMKDNNGATVQRVKATPIPTPAPTIQANSTGVSTETPTIKAGWLLLAILVIGAVVRTAYKNYSQINPASGGFSGLISGITNRNKQDNSYIPEQANKPDFDVGMSTLPSKEDMEEVKAGIEKEVSQPVSEIEPESEKE